MGLRRRRRCPRSGQVWVRTRPLERQLGLLGRRRRPTHPMQELAHRLLGDADALRDGAIGQPLGLQGVDRPGARSTQSSAPLRIPAAAAERREPARLKPPLRAAHRARRAAERARHLVLVGPPLLDQADHRVRFGHPIVERVVRQRHARDDDHTPAILGADRAPAVDRDRTRRRTPVAEQLALLRRSRHGGTMPRLPEKADRFGSAPRAGLGERLRGLAERYVRRSGVSIFASSKSSVCVEWMKRP